MKNRNEPRELKDGEVWYYVNPGSVDLVVREPNVFTKTVRLKRATLMQMLAELQPKPAPKKARTRA